jgi:hypothetical protein
MPRSDEHVWSETSANCSGERDRLGIYMLDAWLQRNATRRDWEENKESEMSKRDPGARRGHQLEQSQDDDCLLKVAES